jgi:hypothetical protein
MNVLIAADAAKRRFAMKTFTIENETNNITLHTTIQDAEAVANAERFSNEAGLAKLAADWPAARLLDIWNSLPGAAAVKRFKDRATAVSRIWEAIQSLGQRVPVTEGPAPGPETAPDGELREAALVQNQEAGEAAQPEVAITKSTAPAPATPVAPQMAHIATVKAHPKKKATPAMKTPAAAIEKKPREGSKTEAILGLMKRPGGTTLKAIMEATDWQAHSVRGFISGTLGKKMGLTVVSAKAENGERSYSISA